MHSEPDKVPVIEEGKNLFSKFIGATEEEKQINTEIVEREFKSFYDSCRIKPFCDNSSDFKDWIVLGLSYKLVMFSCLISLVLSVLGFNLISFELIFLFPFLFLFLLMYSVSFNKLTGGSFNLFKKFKINTSLASKDEKERIKVYSLFSVFLNSNVKEYSPDKQLEVFNDVKSNLEAGKSREVIKSLKVIIAAIDADKRNLETLKSRNKESFEKSLLEDGSAQKLFYSLLNLPCDDVLMNKKSSLAETLLDINIPSKNLNDFSVNFFKNAKKQVGISMSVLCAEAPQTFLLLFNLLFLPILGAIIAQLSVAQNVPDFVYQLGWGVIAVSSFMYVKMLYKNRDSFLKKTYGFEKFYNINRKDGIMSLCLLTIVLKSDFADCKKSEKIEILNKYIESLFSGDPEKIFWKYTAQVEDARNEALTKQIKEIKTNMKDRISKIKESGLEKEKNKSLFLPEKDIDDIVVNTKKDIFFNG